MHIALSRGQIAYQVTLGSPAFDRLTTIAGVVRTLYEKFSPKFSIGLSDIRTATGATLGDVVVRLSLFRGLASVEFRLDGYRAQFEGIRSQADISTIVECLAILEDAAVSIFGNEARSLARITVSAWFKSDEGFDAVVSALSAASRIEATADGFFQNAQMNISGNVSNTTENWSARFLLEPSVNREIDHLFMSLDTHFQAGSAYDSLDRRRTIIGKFIFSILEQADFEVTSAGEIP